MMCLLPPSDTVFRILPGLWKPVIFSMAEEGIQDLAVVGEDDENAFTTAETDHVKLGLIKNLMLAHL